LSKLGGVPKGSPSSAILVPTGSKMANMEITVPTHPNKSRNKPEIPATIFAALIRLTRIRLQSAIYFWLYRGSLPENTARRQPRFWGQNPRPKNSEKTICHVKSRSNGNVVCTHWNRLVPVHGDDYLATIAVAPFLVTSLLAYLPKAVPAQDPNDIYGTANRKALAHLSATSSTFAPAGNVTGAGSNQRSSASLAFRTASSSVSPAEAHPGNSGKNAAQRLVWGRVQLPAEVSWGKE
jgi:hypothetical protein